jgi:spore photoproduct lyase
MITVLYIDAEVAGNPETEAVRSRLGVPGKTVTSVQEVYAALAASRDPVQHGKQVLFLTRNKGTFIKECPGTRHYTCCGYRILHIGTFCTMDCSYCILQAYFHPPLLQFFVNHGDLDNELEGLFAARTIRRIGTGEFTDSLIWGRWSDISTRLVRRFASQDVCVLELKSKTTAVEDLKSQPHNGRTVLAWSLNTERIIRGEERGTTSLEARLQTAADCAQHGYPLAFHFDPLVLYPNCTQEYGQVVERLFAVIEPRHIAWISLGSLRFMPDLKAVIQRRFPHSSIIYGEFISGLDGKMRYFKPLRMQLYRDMAQAIQGHAPGVCIYLCMEDDEVWQYALGFRPAERGGLERMLDESAVRHCGLDPAGLREGKV